MIVLQRRLLHYFLSGRELLCTKKKFWCGQTSAKIGITSDLKKFAQKFAKILEQSLLTNWDVRLDPFSQNGLSRRYFCHTD